MKNRKRLKMILEFYPRGKSNIPSVYFIEGRCDEGIPEGPAFDVFNKAAHDFCRSLIAEGEFDERVKPTPRGKK